MYASALVALRNRAISLVRRQVSVPQLAYRMNDAQCLLRNTCAHQQFETPFVE